MRTLLLIADGYPWWIDGPQQLVKTDEQRSTEISSYGSRSAFMLTRYFCPVDSPNLVPTVVVALRGVVTPWHRQINYNAIMLKCPAGYNIVEPPNPYVQPESPRVYRRSCVGRDEHTGPWCAHVAEAVKATVELVRQWFANNEPVSEMMLDAQLGVESAVLSDGGRETNERWHGNFYEVKDLAITQGWMESGTGRWLMTGYTKEDLAEAKQRAAGWNLDPDVIRAVNAQFWDLV